MSEAGTVNSLVSELTSQGRVKANNVVRLLGLITTCKQEGALKTAVQGLKQFFVAAGQDGLLAEAVKAASDRRPAKRQKVVGAPGDPAALAPAPEAADDPEAKYREWLGRQYDKYVSLLLALATGGSPDGAPPAQAASSQAQAQHGTKGAVGKPPAAGPSGGLPAAARSAGVQVTAAAAVMECARSELGPGVFSGGLYGRLLSGVLLSPSVRPEVFALLFTKYLQLADVRFFTLSAVRALAARYGTATPQQQTEEEEEGEDDEGAGDAAAAADFAAARAPTSSTGVVSLPDLVRNLYDVLSHVPETLPPDCGDWSTWCGGTEYNLVAAAIDRNESSRKRRKLQQEKQQEKQRGAHGASVAKVEWANAKTQKRLFGDAWLALLALPLPPELLRKALLRLPASVLPHMNAPHLLADFLTHCLNRGGLTGMLALNGLFRLVTRHGLEYPQFFARLYQLLEPQAFAARSRAQFFRLADIFLSSPMVPAYTVAAFVKRFARLALTAPPAGAMIAIAFCHNLVRRHPALAVMLHNPGGAAAGAMGQGKEEGKAGGAASDVGRAAGLGVDPYDEAEPDPAKSRAVESSLWEMEALRNHYCPQVSTFCAVLDKDLTDRTKTAEVNVEDVLGATNGDARPAGGTGSYNALIYGELERKLRKVPVAFYAQTPSSLFQASNDAPDWDGWAL